MNTILQQINGTSVTGILCGLVSITDLVKNGEPVFEEANAIFEALLPKLKHNNYKIRTMSFALVEYLLLKSFHLLVTPQEALTNLIFGLSSVNKEIRQSAKMCVRVILTQIPIHYWWKEVDNTIKNTKSKETQYELLRILTLINHEIPLKTIVMLVDSPDSTIRKYCEDIIKKSDREKVLAMLTQCKVSFSTYRRIEKILPIKEKKVCYSNADEEAPIPKQTIPTEQLDDVITSQLEDYQMKPQKQQQMYAPEAKNDLMRAQRIQTKVNVVEEPSDNEEQQAEAEEEERKEKQSVSSLLKEHLLNESKENEEECEEEKSEPLMFESKSKFIQPEDVEASLSASSCCSDDVESLHSMKPNLPLNISMRSHESRSVRSATSKREDAASERSKLSRNSSKKSVKSNVQNEDVQSINSNKPKQSAVIGKIALKPRKSLPFSLRDLTGRSWLERLTFFEILDDALGSGRCTSLKGDDVMKCILSGVFPTHRKLIPISISVLMKAVAYFPESLKANVLPVVTFVLSIYKEKHGDESFDELVSTISQESDKSELFDAAISAENEKNRPVNSSAFILDVYNSDQTIILTQKTICNLISFLLREQPISKASGLVIKAICKNQKENVIKYYQSQTPKTQALLRQFIPRTREQKTQEKPKEEGIITGNMTKDDLYEIIKHESRKVDNANMSKMLAAYKAYVVDDVKELSSLFFVFLTFLSKISDETYQENEETLFNISAAQFSSSKVITMVNSSQFTPKLIVGLSRFVWNCPSSALSQSCELYSFLYDMFCHADGKTRLDITEIVIGIEKATGTSWSSVVEIKPVHKKLLAKLYQQFEIE